MTASCAYCDRPFDQSVHGSAMTRDHIIPRSMLLNAGRGGRSASRNILFEVCGHCNALKGDMLPEGMRDMAQRQRERAEMLERIAGRVQRLIEERRLLP